MLVVVVALRSCIPQQSYLLLVTTNMVAVEANTITTNRRLIIIPQINFDTYIAHGFAWSRTAMYLKSASRAS